ncbi:MAG: hypothetical protein DI551_06965, partial [Micavibrio aeruginosavorus]
MFIDIASSTQLFSKMDDEDVAAIFSDFVEKCTSIITKHNGVVNQTMGDGIYAVFGLDKKNSEHQCLMACLAAQEVLKTFRENLKVRIGVHSGYCVLIDQKFKTQNALFPLVGEVINIAAHICGMASPNGFFISEDSYETMKDSLEVFPAGLFINKEGIQKKVFSTKDSIDFLKRFNVMKGDILLRYFGRNEEVETL